MQKGQPCYNWGFADVPTMPPLDAQKSEIKFLPGNSAKSAGTGTGTCPGATKIIFRRDRYGDTDSPAE